MKIILKIGGVTCIILGGIAISILFAEGFHFFKIDNERVVGGIVFIALTFPAFGFYFLRRSKL